MHIISAQHLHLKKYLVEDGLSHNTVWCSLQDSKGFLWFGTSDGLNRFDGKVFKSFQKSYTDSTSLGNNNIRTLFEDAEEQIWVGTTNGVYIYNRYKNEFAKFNTVTRYHVGINAEVTGIFHMGKDHIWMTTFGQGFFIYNLKTKQLKQNSRNISFVWDAVLSTQNTVFISSKYGEIQEFSKEGKLINEYQLADGFIAKELFVMDNRLWFTTEKAFIGILDLFSKKIQYLPFAEDRFGKLRKFSSYNATETLLATDWGIYAFDIYREEIRNLGKQNQSNLGDETISSITRDKEGGLWFGTSIGGVNYLPKPNKPILSFDSQYPGLERIKIIHTFAEDNHGNIWIGTKNGLRLFDPETKQISQIGIPPSVLHTEIKSLLYEGNHLWIGTMGKGLKKWNLVNQTIKNYTYSKNNNRTITSDDVLALYKCSDGNIYVGTSWGINRYNAIEDNFVTLNLVGSMVSVVDLVEDKKKQLWIATENAGIFKFHIENNSLTHYYANGSAAQKITTNSIISVYQDKKENIWTGTNGEGLLCFDAKKERFSPIDTSNTFLPNQVIYAINEDNLGYLWVSSNMGLTRLSSSQLNKSTSFTKEDGLSSNQFNFNATFKTKKGALLFGSVNGFQFFEPDNFVNNSYVPPTYITKVQLINGDILSTYNDFNPFTDDSKPIQLKFNQNNIQLDFATLSFEGSHKNKFRYKLDGLDKDWIQTKSNIISYNNLSPGNYTFLLKGSNNDEVWSSETKRLKISISYPWWQSNLAKIIYLLLLSGIIYSLINYYKQYHRRQLKLKFKRYKDEQEQKVYQSKIDFFINLMHEIRTPLTLISIPVEKLRQTETSTSKRYLSILNRNVNYLLTLVNQVLDFQKLDNSKTALHYQQTDLINVIEDICQQFDAASEYKNIRLNKHLQYESLHVNIDSDAIAKILFNIIGNAFKYTQSYISITLELFEKKFQIRISDDGAGIPDSEKTKIFDTFYQIDSKNYSGTGIGLSFAKNLAELHGGALTVTDNLPHGATFILEIPLSDDLLIKAKEEIVNNVTVPENQTVAKQFDITILLVEDNEELGTIIQENLMEQFEVTWVKNGQLAIDYLNDHAISLIITDVMMPLVDGYQLTKYVKSTLAFCHIPIIMLTSKSNEEAKLFGLEQGAEVYLEKPISLTYLKMQIENLYKLRLAFQSNTSKIQDLVNTADHLTNKDRDFLKKVNNEVLAHLEEYDFSIDSLAEKLFMSRSNFYRKLKSISGLSPNEYLRKVRLEKAAELLRSREYRISEIYYKVGFSSSSYFAKCFKAEYGVSPKEFI
ncbi:hybrid sensor histidine kinase/response regulator transcription factor [Sphingobacterium alkalisoli]|uniref:hybrid sensor histidine kinase/response regulator transcription factor n=1 Tax=Sphingobacterium alkalisoli TaxID=1874115 RepID=UPI00145FB8BA|nr:hybrid sensor histidine kinase/response regulator transcription factor [Sphingobacterium alkalisoli]